eukprot:9156854-Pyramimonas_sp.AAC.1
MPSIGEGLNHARYLLDRSPRKEPYGRNGAPQHTLQHKMASSTLCPQAQMYPKRNGNDPMKNVRRLRRSSSNVSITLRRVYSTDNLSEDQAAVVFPELPNFPKGTCSTVIVHWY